MKLLATLSAFLFSSCVAAVPLHHVVVFGDSLSDNGNLYEFMKHQLPQSPPYFEGRFTNGPVWIEHLMSSYFPDDPSTHLDDYAFGGAGVSMEDADDEEDVLFTLKREVDAYFLAHHDKAAQDSLYVLWIGANNYLAMPQEKEQALKRVNDGITQTLKRLVDKGAKHVLVVNLPDLGRTPAALEFDSVETMSYFANQHNDALARSVSQLKAEHPDVRWLYFDMNTMFTHVLDHPAEYGFTNTTDSCSNSVVNAVTKKSVLKMVASVTPSRTPDACDKYLFFDLVHPTAYAHKVMAAKARTMLDEAGVEFAP